MPEEFRVRSYAARVHQTGPEPWVTLSGPLFSVEFPPNFIGRVEPGGASFEL